MGDGVSGRALRDVQNLAGKVSVQIPVWTLDDSVSVPVWLYKRYKRQSAGHAQASGQSPPLALVHGGYHFDLLLQPLVYEEQPDFTRPQAQNRPSKPLIFP